jgi:hypothetical protein
MGINHLSGIALKMTKLWRFDGILASIVEMIKMPEKRA